MTKKSDEERYSINKRLTGFARYREILESEWLHFIIIGFVSLVGLMPFIIGMTFAIFTSSVLVLLPVCIIGGIIAGPFISPIYDAVLRCLRDAPYIWHKEFIKALKRNFKDSIIPGIIFCLFFGFYIFMAMMMLDSGKVSSGGTIALFIFSAVLFIMVFSTIMPQVVLFSQKGFTRLKNSILFCIMHFWKVLLVAIIQILFMGIMFLFMPWTLIILPFLNIWFIVFISCFLLYDHMNNDFEIEKQIEEQFPEQVRDYEETINN